MDWMRLHWIAMWNWIKYIFLHIHIKRSLFLFTYPHQNYCYNPYPIWFLILCKSFLPMWLMYWAGKYHEAEVFGARNKIRAEELCGENDNYFFYIIIKSDFGGPPKDGSRICWDVSELYWEVAKKRIYHMMNMSMR